MRWSLALVLIGVLAGCAGTPEARDWYVLRVIDGDTFVAEGPGAVRVRMRLRNFDAPELDEPGGPEAKAALEARLLDKRVEVRSYATDRYGRAIVTVESRR